MMWEFISFHLLSSYRRISFTSSCQAWLISYRSQPLCFACSVPRTCSAFGPMLRRYWFVIILYLKGQPASLKRGKVKTKHSQSCSWSICTVQHARTTGLVIARESTFAQSEHWGTWEEKQSSVTYLKPRSQQQPFRDKAAWSLHKHDPSLDYLNWFSLRLMDSVWTCCITSQLGNSLSLLWSSILPSLLSRSLGVLYRHTDAWRSYQSSTRPQLLLTP